MQEKQMTEITIECFWSEKKCKSFDGENDDKKQQMKTR